MLSLLDSVPTLASRRVALISNRNTSTEAGNRIDKVKESEPGAEAPSWLNKKLPTGYWNEPSRRREFVLSLCSASALSLIFRLSDLFT